MVALQKAEEVGRLLAPPFGDDGLKIETSREIVEMMTTVPVGDDIGVIVVGPLDDVKVRGAMDVLLKTLEEFDPRFFQPILWARDAGSVLGTVRSRCLELWCPMEGEGGPETPYLSRAEKLCLAALERRRAALIEILIEEKGSEDMLLRASAIVLSKKEEWPLTARLLLWARIRELLFLPRPSHLETLTAFWV